MIDFTACSTSRTDFLIHWMWYIPTYLPFEYNYSLGCRPLQGHLSLKAHIHGCSNLPYWNNESFETETETYWANYYPIGITGSSTRLQPSMIKKMDFSAWQRCCGKLSCYLTINWSNLDFIFREESLRYIVIGRASFCSHIPIENLYANHS